MFIANESSNANKLTFFNDLIKVYDARRIRRLLVLPDWLIVRKKKLWKSKKPGASNYFPSFMKIGIFVSMIFLRAFDLCAFLLSVRLASC